MLREARRNMLKKPLQKHFGFNSFLKGWEEVIRKVVTFKAQGS